jgi:hypothetical protein
VVIGIRPEWAPDVARMEEICMPRRLMYMQPEGLSKLGRPRTVWTDVVGKGARMLGIRSWWAAAMNPEKWKKRL